MSYTKEIEFRDYTINFEYYCDRGEALHLSHWTAYEGVEEALISCKLESDFIESQLHDWLDKEWSRNGCNYIEEMQISGYMKRCSEGL